MPIKYDKAKWLTEVKDDPIYVVALDLQNNYIYDRFLRRLLKEDKFVIERVSAKNMKRLLEVGDCLPVISPVTRRKYAILIVADTLKKRDPLVVKANTETAIKTMTNWLGVRRNYVSGILNCRSGTWDAVSKYIKQLDLNWTVQKG